MGLARLALRNPYVVVVLGLALATIGGVAIYNIPTDLLPQFKTPAVQILTLYPGMPAETVERDISTRMQRWTGQSVGIEHQEARSMLGVSVVRDYFQEGIDPNSALSQVNSYAQSDLYYLPPGTVPPMVMPIDPTASIPLCLFSVKSDKYNETELYDIAYFQLRNRLQSIPGVIAPAVFGGKIRRILAYVRGGDLAARGLSPMDVVDSLHKYNVFIPTGTARLGQFEYQIESNAMVSGAEGLNDFPIRLDGNAPILIKDVGEGKDASELQSNIVRVDGKRQLYVPIYRQPGANTIKVVDGVKDAIPEIMGRLPDGGKDIQLEVVFDQSDFVRKAIRDLAVEGAIGAGLAALMVLLFLRSLRATFFILLTLPLSLLAAVIGLYFTGHTINAMTLGGFAIAVGLLIDQSIVVLENTERHLAMGKTAAQAALDGALEVATPVLVIVVGTCVVFFPVVFISGIGKFLFTPLAVAVTLSLLASYFMALMVVPACCANFLGAREERGAGWFEGVQRGYAALLGGALRARWGLVLVSLALFGGAAWLYPRLGKELFPRVDSRQILIRARVTSGTQVAETEKTMIGVEKAVQESVGPALKKLITNIGVLNDWPAAYTPNAGPHDAFLLVQIADDAPLRDREYVAKLRRELPVKFPGTEFSFEPNSMVRNAVNYGLPAPIDVQVQGNDLWVSMGVAEEIKKRVSAIAGTVDVRIQQRLDYPQFKLNIDRRRCAELGITQDDVVKNVVAAFNSSVSFSKSFWIDEKNGNHYWIGAQYPESEFKDLDTLLDVPITGKSQGMPVMLRNVATFERTTAPSEVSHYKLSRVIDVFSDIDGRDLGGVAADVETALVAIEKEGKVPSGYTILRRGEVTGMNESFDKLGLGLLLATVLVYLVMVIQFRSLLDPLIVLIAIPLGFVGVVAALWLTGTYVSIQALMGVIMMVGIVKSFSLLMIDFANRRRAEGASPREAILDAARVRLRPILMTAIAAALGLVPMAASGGANAPLARAVIGGVAASTLLTLFLVPVLYTLFKREKANA